ncbi:MAG: di-heme oxidoredictase family protein [Polyangia bacterium]
MKCSTPLPSLRAARAGGLGLLCLSLVSLWLVGCGEPVRYPADRPRQAQTLALDASGQRLAVVNPEADSLSILDVEARQLVREIPLGPRPVAGPDGRFEPRHAPRGVDLSPDGRLAYVACQGSGRLLTVDVESAAVVQELPLGAEPVTALVHPSGEALYVALYQSGEVVRLPLVRGLPDETGALRRRTTDRPFGLSLDGAGQRLYVTRFLLTPGLDVLDAATLMPQAQAGLDEVKPRGNKLLAHGVPRGVYGAAVRPGPAGEVWLPHLLLAVDVAQPELDFESTVFPTVSLRGAAGEAIPGGTLSTDSRLPKIDGAFADVVSGPRAIAFTPDGSLALVVNMSSEDVLVIDAERRVQAQLLRPLPGDLPEGIVVSPDGRRAFIDQRASGDVAVLQIAEPGAAASGSDRVRLEPQAIPRLAAGDPMPAELRLGQRLFYSANSAEFPITKNFWVACSSCHLEGRSDGVTWLFATGPRDTPSNAGGTLGTGFLMRNATRNQLQQYDETIRIEQGGDFDLTRPADKRLLDALSNYVDRAVPLPRSPEIDARTGELSAAAQRGQAVWSKLQCERCHGGPRYTDSGTGNPGLDLGGSVMLHDVGTCAGAPFPDQPALARDGAPRPACAFDTPGLRGVSDTAPYLHDGRAATLEDVIDHFVRVLQLPPPTAAERADLAAFLRSL